MPWPAPRSHGAPGRHRPAAWPEDATVAADRERILGPEHPKTLTARANLAASYQQAGRTADAIATEERTAADMERILGTEHPTLRQL